MNDSTNGNGRNGLFLKVMVGVNVALMGAGVIGGIKLYRDVGVLQESSHLEKRVEVVEATVSSINADRHQRTIILQTLREEVADNKRRIEALEKRK